ncbi:DUF4142 domain-containing protein [Belnapia rosea]|uniref:DUF4142 domain-containing protein n=1 Tax=Belnapia rosea TaxID=938405 RepID=UPI0008805F6D|nr:DUF4142 domain-containing protein [Belnapia rosea]SDB74319.1 Predicted outer membrane protein [Belnapia rosea]
MLRRELIRTAALAAAACAASVQAQAQASIRPDPKPRLPPQPGQGLAVEDARSLQRAAQLSDVQIEVGRLGTEKSATPEVKQLAVSIAEDNARFRRIVDELAAAHRVELPQREASDTKDRSLAALREGTGEAFDRAFLERQLRLYPSTAELYQTMASNSPDTSIARFGITALAALRAHFESAKALGARFGLTAEVIEKSPQY